MLTNLLPPDVPFPGIINIPYLKPQGKEIRKTLGGFSGKRRVYHKLNKSDPPAIRAEKLMERGKITNRDYHILKSLLGVGVLSRQQIQRLFWHLDSARQTVCRRLALLTGAERQFLEFTDIHKDTLESIGLERCRVYGLSVTGRELIAIREGRKSWRYVAYNEHYYELKTVCSIMRHHLMTSEIYTRLKVKSNRAGNDMMWFNEMACIIYNGKQELVRPDGYTTISCERFSEVATAFIETDTRHTDWEKKIQSYETAKAEGDWATVLGVSQFPLVLCVVPSQRAIERVTGMITNRRYTHVTYLFKPWHQFLIEDPYVGWYHAKADKVVKILPDKMIEEQR